MSEFTVTRTLKAPRARVWQVLTQAGHFEGWLPAKSGTAVLDVRTGGSWRATVISSEGVTLTPAPDDSTQIAYAFDVDESMHAMVTESVDDVLGRVSTVLAGIA